MPTWTYFAPRPLLAGVAPVPVEVIVSSAAGARDAAHVTTEVPAQDGALVPMVTASTAIYEAPVTIADGIRNNKPGARNKRGAGSKTYDADANLGTCSRCGTYNNKHGTRKKRGVSSNPYDAWASPGICSRYDTDYHKREAASNEVPDTTVTTPNPIRAPAYVIARTTTNVVPATCRALAPTLVTTMKTIINAAPVASGWLFQNSSACFRFRSEFVADVAVVPAIVSFGARRSQDTNVEGDDLPRPSINRVSEGGGDEERPTLVAAVAVPTVGDAAQSTKYVERVNELV